MLIVLQWAEPLDSKFSIRMETFNECTNLMILYTLLLFSDYLDPSVRSDVGYVYMGIVIGFAAVHLSFILGSSFVNICQKIKQCYVRRKVRKMRD